MIEFTSTKGVCRIFHRKEKMLIQKNTFRSHDFIEKEKLRKYLSGILSTDHDEAYLENKTNQLINDISDFLNKHIIQCNNKTISNIPKEPRYIPSMTPIGFMNGQDESICYVNSSFQVLFSISFLER